MLCEKCGQREALIHVTQRAGPDGIIRQRDWCEECGKDEVPKLEKILESQNAEWLKALELILAKDSRYEAEAYEFVVEAMDNAFADWNAAEPADTKMPSKQLVVALQRLASERFGKCAAATFNLWGVTRWQDFGEIVSRMQEAKMFPSALFEFNQDDFKSRGVLDDVFPER